MFRRHSLFSLACTKGLLVASLPMMHAQRAQSSFDKHDAGSESTHDDLHDDLQSELAQVMQSTMAAATGVAASSSSLPTADVDGSSSSAAGGEAIHLTKLVRPPAKFDLLTHSFAYEWRTTARLARKVVGPMREWANEIKYRTGVHVEMDPTYPEKLAAGDYKLADDVEITVYLFGTDRGVVNAQKVMEAAIQQDPSYVRLGVFRRKPDNSDVEWLTLRRINRDHRPPDIPKISLKLPGKYTLLYENYKEAAIRTLWEETGITAPPVEVYPSGYLRSTDPLYFWRVPVRYFVAEVPFGVEVKGPQATKQSYMMGWDSRILRQSPDAIDREWARLANPETGCAWMSASLLDELQRPLRGFHYMATRYTPPPHSGLQEVVNLIGAGTATTQ
ncbi:NUDIX hydrolase, putative [Bodo saltans]|uniref:NUDIX hydrolase, putative n=1 Tax=Bodo saltans TaxID=75058 RepID=A0A0S4IUS1_BODSA|nr:NUDIX hydrolase, putative [Bodo saltans]|eukprot:CUG12728.1 NUDIX hydrolase, putative [Bodo saltans]